MRNLWLVLVLLLLIDSGLYFKFVHAGAGAVWFALAVMAFFYARKQPSY